MSEQDKADPVEQEPKAWMYQNKNTNHQYLVWNKSEGGRNWQPLYTHPKEWVGLTEEEILNSPWAFGANDVLINFARAIEDALKEKNT